MGLLDDIRLLVYEIEILVTRQNWLDFEPLPMT
jgi:hypothetical protein